MNKYDELKQRIEALSNGWDKEADDILIEIDLGNKYINISACASDLTWTIEIEDSTDETFFDISGSGQCEKMKGFRKALIWLLDHSSIKKDNKQDKIKDLENRMDILRKEIKELKKG